MLITDQIHFFLLITGLLAVLEDKKIFLQVPGTLINFVLGILIFLFSLSFTNKLAVV